MTEDNRRERYTKARGDRPRYATTNPDLTGNSGFERFRHGSTDGTAKMHQGPVLSDRCTAADRDQGCKSGAKARLDINGSFRMYCCNRLTRLVKPLEAQRSSQYQNQACRNHQKHQRHNA